MLQQQSGNDWVLVQAGSCFLSDPESRYAIIELELLAVSWVIVKCNVFLAGLPHFVVLTDHHPLVPILNSHRLDEIENPRLQRLRTRIISQQSGLRDRLMACQTLQDYYEADDCLETFKRETERSLGCLSLFRLSYIMSKC